MKVSAKDVKKLRDLTGAGMMDCKKALVEAEGNTEKAVEILRKKGQKILGKRADREANEGAVIAVSSADGSKGVVVNISAETDFVSKNADFVAMANQIANIAIEHFPATLEELRALPYNDSISIQEKTVEQAGVIGEKIELAKYERMESELVVPYIHAGNRLGVLVGMTQNTEDAKVAGKNVAMQIAAMHPVALDKGDVPQAVIDKEIEINLEIARKEYAGKPEQMIQNIVKGKVNKLFFKQKTLLNQTYVKDSKSTVRGYLESVNKDLTVNKFYRVTLG